MAPTAAPSACTGSGRRLSVVAIAKKVAPYLIAAVALGWVLRHIKTRDLLDALHRAPMGAFIAMSAVMLVLNCGADTFAKSLRAVRMNGRIYLIGILSGGGGQVNPTPILMKNARVQGIYVGSREMFEAMNRALTLHKLRPVVDRVFAFQEIRDALRYMESGAHFGKICIRIS